VADRLGHPEGIIAFDPSSFPKRGSYSVGVKRQWCSHRGKVDTCQVGVFMGYVSGQEHALLDFRLSLPEEWARDKQRRQACHVPPEVGVCSGYVYIACTAYTRLCRVLDYPK
jgi:SRSO17 transposase